MKTPESDRICQDSWDRALHAYGTAEIFKKRVRRYRRLIRALTFMGIIVPALIGGVVIAFGTDAAYLTAMLWLAGVAGIIQLFFSVWAVVNKWDDELEYSLESVSQNFELSSIFTQLGQCAPAPPTDLMVRFAAAQAKDDARRAADDKKSLSPKEIRYAHRAGLRQFQRKCKECQIAPVSMDSTNCPVCGRF
jgi:mobilome CxxCx(11)CxxC protein